MRALNCVLRRVDKVYCSARSDAVLCSLAILLVAVWIFHLGLSIRERLEVGKVITVFTFQSSLSFHVPRSLLYPQRSVFHHNFILIHTPKHSLNLQKWAEHFLEKKPKKTGSRGWSPKNFLTSRVALKPTLNVLEPDGLIFARRRIRRVLYLPGLWRRRGAAGTSSLHICSYEMTEIRINHVPFYV